MARSAGAVEDAVAAQLRDACLVTRVTANRMRLTMAEGLVLNIVAAPLPRSAAESSVIAVARTVLAAMTRHEAAHWAGQGIRINAVAPTTGLGRPAAAGGGSLGSEPDIAALALFLASRAGRELSGLLFDAAGAAVCC
jgi:3-oxoacyl-[acyl-carrier protein] reductase